MLSASALLALILLSHAEKQRSRDLYTDRVPLIPYDLFPPSASLPLCVRIMRARENQNSFTTRLSPFTNLSLLKLISNPSRMFDNFR